MNDKIKKGTNLIDKLANIKWKILSFIFLVLILCLLNPKTIIHPYLMMEDGFVFINGIIKDGLPSFGDTYGGYLCVASRIISLIAVTFGKLFNSIVIEAHINKFVSMFAVAYIVNRINDDSYSFISKKRIVRLLYSILLLLLSANFLAINYTSLSMNWWSGLYILMCILLLLNNKKLRIHEIIFLFIAILSTPFSFVLFIPLLFDLINLITKKVKISKSKIIFYAISSIFLFIQICSILNSNDVDSASNVSFGLSSLYVVIKYTIYLCFLSLNYLLTPIYYHFMSTNLLCGLISGSIIFALLLYLSIKKKCLKYLFTICSITFIIYALTLIKYNVEAGTYFQELIDQKHVVWYHLLPAMNVFIIFFILIKDIILNNKIIKIIGVTVFIMISTILWKHNYEPDLDYVHYMYEIDEYTDYHSDTYTCVKIPPKWVNWCVLVPVKENYCKGEENECTKNI